MEERKETRLVLIPLPLQGHINPMLELANILYSKGFSITILNFDFNALNPLNYPQFTFHSVSCGLSESELSTLDLVDHVRLMNTRCEKPLQDFTSKLLPEEPISCLISDAAFYSTQGVADALKLPRLVLRTSGLASFLAYAAFNLLRERGYLPVQDSKLEEAVIELPPLQVKDLPVFNARDPEQFHQLVLDMANTTKGSSGLIFNTFEELEPPELLSTLRNEFNIPIFLIGPFHKYFPQTSSSSSSLLTQDQSSISWLDNQLPNSVIYVSFGSIAAMTEKEFLEIAWGLACSKHPFLWVVRPGLVHGSQWLEPLPSGFLEDLGGRGHIVKWAPQQQVLTHPAVGAFWTHNGWNSTLESICEGIPMICMPFFTDQKVNAKYVTHVWKVGVKLDNMLNREEIEMTINRVLVEEEGKKIRERVLKFKEKAYLCMEEGGSSFQHMNRLVNRVS